MRIRFAIAIAFFQTRQRQMWGRTNLQPAGGILAKGGLAGPAD